MPAEITEQYLQVAIPVPMRQTFSYRLPAELAEPKIQCGERVIVPFANRQLVAIVVAISQENPYSDAKTKAITSRVNDQLILDQQLLSFLERCAQYYHHPIGDVFQQALPILLRKIKQPDVELPQVWLAQQPINAAKVTKLRTRAPKQAALIEQLEQHPELTWPELSTLGYSKNQLLALEKKQLVVSKTRSIETFTWQASALNEENKLALSAEQAIIVSSINASKKFTCHLIDGITGSGKTEVYLQAMEQVLADNKQVLVLVPEIGLTPQTLSRFEQRFKVPICLHHSGLNNQERLQTWLEAQRGSAAIVIGTRSAIFTPLHNLGLIIVDEEHDGSFKQQDSFRYHGRDIAILRARQLNIPIILGSATPSLESLHNALSGRFQYHQLVKRAGNALEAPIKLIDINQQPLEYGLSATLKQAIAATLKRGEQVLLFLNRRGYAPAIHCQECHWLAECIRCNRPFTLHQKQQLVICHHCSDQYAVPVQCPCCGSVRIKPLGQGTEQLEEKIISLFPEYSAVRIDRDSTRKKGALAKLLQQINDKEHQLLIGTQMLAKGHHFPNVTLVALLEVDGALFSYDFRAAEHMAQLLVQVSGRAGRASKPGQVLVQSQYPEHPLLQDLIHNGYQHFAQQALSERKLACLPPFNYQALFRAEANFPSYPIHFLTLLSQQAYDGCQFAGPMPAPMEKKAGKYRYHLLIQAKTRQQLHYALSDILTQLSQNQWQNKVRWSVDIDPVELTW